MTLGLIRKFKDRSDLVGISAGWGSPPDDSLKDQTTIEAFWRFQFSQGLAITPSLQLLIDPALNPDHDKIWVYGLRVRLAFLRGEREPDSENYHDFIDIWARLERPIIPEQEYLVVLVCLAQAAYTDLLVDNKFSVNSP